MMNIRSLELYRSSTPTAQRSVNTPTPAAPTLPSTAESIIATPITSIPPHSLLDAEEQQFFLDQFPAMRKLLQEYFSFDQRGKLHPLDPGVGNLVDVRL